MRAVSFHRRAWAGSRQQSLDAVNGAGKCSRHLARRIFGPFRVEAAIREDLLEVVSGSRCGGQGGHDHSRCSPHPHYSLTRRRPTARRQGTFSSLGEESIVACDPSGNRPYCKVAGGIDASPCYVCFRPVAARHDQLRPDGASPSAPTLERTLQPGRNS
jgi:hypothetical protein